MFHTLAYHFTSGAAAQTNADVAAVTDPIITTRNSHFIFTDPYKLLQAYVFSATLTASRLNAPSINAYGRHHFWPLDSTGVQPAVVPDLPAVSDYSSQPMNLPMNEELAVEVSNTAVIAEDFVALLFVCDPAHNVDAMPAGIQRLTMRATYSITSVAYAWTGPGALTFEQSPRGGWYSVVGLNVFDANTLAARLLFPRARLYDGRILRPGAIAQNAVARRPWWKQKGFIGVYGKFHSFELPQIEILSVNAAAHTGEVRIDLVYHGEQEPSGY